ncbi:unnamed protein product, partial [Ixodes pacificus]
ADEELDLLPRSAVGAGRFAAEHAQCARTASTGRRYRTRSSRQAPSQATNDKSQATRLVGTLHQHGRFPRLDTRKGAKERVPGTHATQPPQRRRMDIETNKTADEGHQTRPKNGLFFFFFGRGLLTRGSPGDSWENGMIMAPRGLGAAFADKDPERGPFFSVCILRGSSRSYKHFWSGTLDLL